MTCSHALARAHSPGACLLCPEPEVDEDQAQALHDFAMAELRRLTAFRCSKSLADFVRESWHVLEPATKLEWNWHHEELCFHLQEMFFDWQKAQDDDDFVQRARNLVANVPPGSLKSRIIAVCFPVWAWVHCPSWRVICLSVTKDAVYRDARLSRSLIQSEWFQKHFRPTWTIKDDQDAISDYGNTAGGSRLSKPSGSEIVGLRADCLILDDPNNPLESHSEKARRQVNALWNTNTYNRVNSMAKSLHIIVQQRTHEMDLTGFVLDQAKKAANSNRPGSEAGALVWCHLCFPAEFEAKRACKTVFGGDRRTLEGESIHPKLLTRAVIESEKQRFGPYDYAGQMQQSPAPAGGGLFKEEWFKSVKAENLPTMDEVVMSLDANAKKTLTGSRAALVAVGAASAQRYVLDAVADSQELDWICQQFRDMHARLVKLGCRPRKIIVEMQALGPAFVSQMRREIASLNMEIVETTPGDDKYSRAKAVVPVCAAGNVAVLAGALWVEPYLHELCVFPAGAHDDYVDATSQALTELAEGDSNAQFASRRGGIWG